MESSLANVKRLHYLIDRTARACHMLDLNSTVMKTMMKCHEDSSDTESSFRKEIYAVLEECQVLHKAAGSLLVRATSISQHVSRPAPPSQLCDEYWKVLNIAARSYET